MSVDITAAIVLYKNAPGDVEMTIRCFLNTDLNVRLALVDNSPDDRLSMLRKIDADRISYLHVGKNIGFGAGHNNAFHLLKRDAPYHLILNPDITFRAGSIEELVRFMREDEAVGCVVPRVVYPDGRLQYACRLLPSPVDFGVRWLSSVFGLLRNYEARRNEIYELRCSGYQKQMNVPFVSGCFMLFRSSVLAEIGGFDERFFLYVEDVDLSRRVHRKYKTIYYPQAEVVHVYGRAAHRNLRAFYYFIRSSIRYFNKWGWFWDRERRMVNEKALSELGY